MRPHFLTSALLLLVGCSDTLPPRDPPSNSFAFPSGLVHQPSTGENGTLYVASSNFDKFYDSGAVLAVDLDSAGGEGVLSEPLPLFGTRPDPIPEITLRVPEESIRFIQSISGELALYTPQAPSPRAGSAPYLFVPSRAEGDFLQVLRAEGARLSCVGTDSRRCFDRAITLTESAGLPGGLPGAPGPIGVTVGQGASAPELWVTHISAALPPTGEDRSAAASTFVVRANPDEVITQLEDAGQRTPLQLPTGNFVLLDRGNSPLAGAHAVALGPDYAFLSGRAVANAAGSNLPFLLRAMKRSDTSLFIDPDLRGAYPNVEARGVALNAAGTRLYLAARATGSTLLVADVQASGTKVNLKVVRALDTLPPGASVVRVISRGAGRGDLVLVTCSVAGVLAIYDDEVGDIVAQVQDLGEQPYALAVAPRSSGTGLGARVYVANFGDGRVSVVDINNLDKPQDAHVVARLGTLQRCAGQQANDDDCTEAAP